MKRVIALSLALLFSFGQVHAQPGGNNGKPAALTPTVISNSSPGTFAQSSSVMTLQVSSALADRATVLSGVSGGFELGIAQEPSVFWNPTAGNWGMVYTGNNAVGYATAPSITGPFTRRGQILGGGVGGVSAGVSHVRAIVVGGLIYITYPNFATNTFMITNGAPMPSGTSAPVFTSNSALLTVSSYGVTSGLMGNSKIIQVGSTYYLFWEAFQTSTNGWQMGVATNTSLTGAYTEQLYPITTLRPASPTAVVTTPGGPDPFYENGTFVMYYHAGIAGNTTKIYRAFSTSPTTDAWAIDNNGQPWLDRELPNEVSQVADIDIVPTTNGYYAFWEGVNNAQSTAAVAGAEQINSAPLQEPLYSYEPNSGRWLQMLGVPKTTPQEFDYNGSPYTASFTIANHEFAMFDPNTAASNLTATLPYADYGARARVCNSSYTGTYSVLVAAQSGDGIIAGSPALAPGECATFYASIVNNWTREFGISRYGTTNFVASSVQNFYGTTQMLSGSYFVAYSGANVQFLSGSTFLLQSVAIASLPTCNTGVAGTYNTVNNGVASPTYMAVVSATGSATDPVFCNGSNWVYH